MKEKILYKDTVIEVKLLPRFDSKDLKVIALRYVKPNGYNDKNGNKVEETNAMGGETDWFIIPYTFSELIGKKLFEQYSAGLDGFDKSEIKILKKWLIEMEVIDDCMCY